jgi:hypothetical protein
MTEGSPLVSIGEGFDGFRVAHATRDKLVLCFAQCRIGHQVRLTTPEAMQRQFTTLPADPFSMSPGCIIISPLTRNAVEFGTVIPFGARWFHRPLPLPGRVSASRVLTHILSGIPFADRTDCSLKFIAAVDSVRAIA